MQQYGAVQAPLLTVQAGAVVHPVGRSPEIATLHKPVHLSRSSCKQLISYMSAADQTMELLGGYGVPLELRAVQKLASHLSQVEDGTVTSQDGKISKAST